MYRIGNAGKMFSLVLGVNIHKQPSNAEIARLGNILSTARSEKPREEKIETIINSLRSLESSWSGRCCEAIRRDCIFHNSERCPYQGQMLSYKGFMGKCFDPEFATSEVRCEIADAVVRKAAIALLGRIEPKNIFAFIRNGIDELFMPHPG